MRLRRVIDHFRKLEWTAIAIDFVITVLGVFIGLQVANWNQTRVEQANAHTYLERIHADLDADLRNYRNRLAFWSAVSQYGRTGLAYAETGNAGSNSQWELLLAYFQASQVEEYFTTSTTYDELRSAGQLNLISDLALRNGLAGYYTNAANPTLSERPVYRVHVRGIVPIDVQTYIWTHCYTSDRANDQAMHACSSPISDAAAAQIVRSISRDTTLMAELRYWISTMQVAGLIGQGRVDVATQLRAQVESDLGR